MHKESEQTAPPLRIRHGMDVYSAYQNQYLGTVVKVWQEPVPQPSDVGPFVATQPQQQIEEALHNSSAKRLLGEDLGPFPTGSIGNTGPRHQVAGQSYATKLSRVESGVVCFAVRPVRIGGINLFARKLYIPTSAVMSISMERIILDVQQDQIPAAWYKRPLA